MLTASLRRTAVLVPLIAVLATSGVSAAGLQNAGRPACAGHSGAFWTES